MAEPAVPPAPPPDRRQVLRHPIGVVVRRTGMKPDLIRAWERRYQAVTPGRTPTRRRLYSDADVDRLLLLRQVVLTGHGIGQVATFSDFELRDLLANEPRSPLPPRASTPSTPSVASVAGTLPASPDDPLAPPSPTLSGASTEAPAPGLDASGGGTDLGLADQFLSLCLDAARRLDVRELESQVERAAVGLGRANLLDRLFVPLMHRIGDLWKQGELRPAHEHLASSVVRSFLGGLHDAYSAEPSAPHLVVTTPSRQRHELGALIVAATAAAEGWRVTYLGPDLPPEEIAAAALQTAARAVALSVVYPPDDPLLGDDLRTLRRLLAPATALLIGGRSAANYAAVLAEIGTHPLIGMVDLRRELDYLRRPLPDHDAGTAGASP